MRLDNRMSSVQCVVDLATHSNIECRTARHLNVECLMARHLNVQYRMFSQLHTALYGVVNLIYVAATLLYSVVKCLYAVAFLYMPWSQSYILCFFHYILWV